MQHFGLVCGLYEKDLLLARALGLYAGILIVYKIPYRRARAWPSGCL